MKTFDFNTLKDNTFCIYDVKEGQVERIKDIMEELGMKGNKDQEDIYAFCKSSTQTKNCFAAGEYSWFSSCYSDPEETYRKTATEFLDEYAEWKIRSRYEYPANELPLKELAYLTEDSEVLELLKTAEGNRLLPKKKYITEEDFFKTDEPHYKQYIGKKYAVHCKTQEEWERVAKALNYDRFQYFDKDMPCEGTNDVLYRCGVAWTKSKGYTILSVAEFFGEEDEHSLKVIEKMTKNLYTYGTALHYCEPGISNPNFSNEDILMPGAIIKGISMEEYRKAYQKLDKYINKPNKIKKFMTNIVDHAKFALLSQDEKDLRNAGLKDGEGRFTSSAADIVLGLEANSRGFSKGFKEMKAMTGKGEEYSSNISVLEMQSLFTTYEKELLAAAKAYNKDQNKK